MPQAKWTEWLQRAALLLSTLFVVLLLGLFALRFGHPYLLEWQEGAMVDQVARILAGEPLYAEPTIDFVAQIYAPLYFHASAAVAAWTGIGFAPLRAVSIAATLGILACMGGLVWFETRSRAAVVLCLGLFAATYPLGAAFLDIARVDALFLFFCIAGVAVVRMREGTLAMLVAAALFVLAFLTKQQGALFCVAMTAWVAVARGLRPACLLGGAFAGAAWACTFALSTRTDGWSSFYLFDLPGSHEIFWPMLGAFWWMDLLRPLGLACGLAAAWLVVLARERRTSDLVFWVLLLGVCTATALGSRMHWGGATNVVLPAYLGIALAWAVALHRLALAAPDSGAGSTPWPTVLVALALAQLLWLVYDPRPLVPRDADRRAGDAFVAALAELDGDVLATWHGYLPTLAGKAVFAHRSAVYDVMRSDQTEVISKLRSDFDAALAAQRFGAVVVDQPLFLRDYERASLERHYRHVGPMLEAGLEVGGLLGYRANPHLYLPRDGPRDGPRDVSREASADAPSPVDDSAGSGRRR